MHSNIPYSSKTAEKGLPYARHLAGKFKIPIELLALVAIAPDGSSMAISRTGKLMTCSTMPASSSRGRMDRLSFVSTESMPTQTGVAAIYRF